LHLLEVVCLFLFDEGYCGKCVAGEWKRREKTRNSKLLSFYGFKPPSFVPLEFQYLVGSEMSASPIARQATQCQTIPSRRVVINDASQLPIDYSTTPGGTVYSTTPGGRLAVCYYCALV
jgi:hypothetical protein